MYFLFDHFLQVFASHHYLLCMASCCDLMRSDSGSTEKVLNSLFEKAKLHLKEGPTALIFDEIGKSVTYRFIFRNINFSNTILRY